jgi:hypothetical protein
MNCNCFAAFLWNIYRGGDRRYILSEPGVERSIRFMSRITDYQCGSYYCDTSLHSGNAKQKTATN